MIEVTRFDVEHDEPERCYGTSPSFIKPLRQMHRARLDLLLDDAGLALLRAAILGGFQAEKPAAPEVTALPSGPLVAEFDDEPALLLTK